MLSNSGPAANETEFLTGPNGARLAISRTPGSEPGIVFFGGLRSSMEGAKALHVEAWCRREGRACLRFDYSGHGRSDGRFEDGTITRWLADARAVLDEAVAGPQIFVGSSLGGWIALLLAIERPEKLAGFMGISTAADFTEFIYNELFSDAHREEMRQDGRVRVPDCHGGPPFEITRNLIEDGKRHLLLTRDAIPLSCPVRMIHARHDRDAPWDAGLRLADRIAGADVRVTIVKDSDHQLARPVDLVLLDNEMTSILNVISTPEADQTQ